METTILNIRNMILTGQEDIVREYIETFSSEKLHHNGGTKNLNPDVERFLKKNAVQFAKMKTSITYLIIDDSDDAVLGFFTLAHKPLTVPADGLSRKIREKLERFSILNEENNTYTISAFLIAQLGKNYAVENGKRFSGKQVIAAAKEQLMAVQDTIGGMFVYLDCEANAKLINFYERENFLLFGERMSDIDKKRYLQYLTLI